MCLHLKYYKKYPKISQMQVFTSSSAIDSNRVLRIKTAEMSEALTA